MKIKKFNNQKIINVQCVCGNKFLILSSLNQDLSIDICDQCHPLYVNKIGKKKLKKNKFNNIYNELF